MPNKNVLIIEDNPGHLALISRAFESMEAETGFTIHASENLSEAREALSNTSFDLVITDIQLPDGKGTDLLKIESVNLFPIVVMTSHGSESAAVDAIKEGALNYVVKSNEAFFKMPFFAINAIQEWELTQRTKKYEQEIIQKNVMLEKSNKELERISYSISHDLSTPVSGIIKLTKWIEEDLENVDKNLLKNFELLKLRALRLKNFIDGIEDFGQLNKIIQPEKLEATTLINEVINSIEVPDIVKICIQSNLPQIVATKYLISRTLESLVGNAIKHNPSRNLTIEISCKEKEDYFIFSIKDNGCGIGEKYHKRIFKMFQILEERDKNENIGLGLTVARKIVENVGGSIWVESTPENGADFRFTWPTEIGLTQSFQS